MDNFLATKIIDCHTHLSTVDTIEKNMNILTESNISTANVVSISCFGGLHIIENALCGLAKLLYPGKLYGFGGLYYPESGVNTSYDSFLKQAERLMCIGFDGIKMLEGKPDVRKKNGIPLNSELYDNYFSYVEEKEIPILYHVADPALFWDKDKAPKMAFENGWLYLGDSFVSKENLYREVEEILKKHPKLRIIFAHFYFMGEEGIKRASEFLDQWTEVGFDITPGIEMYGSFTENPDEWREFFIKYQDRIFYGTDTGFDATSKTVHMIRSFLETDMRFEFHNYQIQGIKLEPHILEKIYRKNFERLVGITPGKINAEMVLEECYRIIERVQNESLKSIIIPEVKKIIERIPH